MIIRMDHYRTSLSYDDLINEAHYAQICGNTVRRPKFTAQWEPSPELPDDFDDFNAKAFIDRAYGLATQI